MSLRGGRAAEKEDDEMSTKTITYSNAQIYFAAENLIDGATGAVFDGMDTILRGTRPTMGGRTSIARVKKARAVCVAWLSARS